jgi:hypothetical protein
MRLRMGRAGAVVLAFVLLAAAGCLVMRDETVTERGQAVARGQLKGVREGATTVQDLIRSFGAPEQRMKFDDGREVLTYVYERTVRSELGVLFVLNWKGQKRRLTRYSFEFKDGLLSRQWHEDVL